MQTSELLELSQLAKDASEILYEMHVMSESGDSVQEMILKSEQLQVR